MSHPLAEINRRKPASIKQFINQGGWHCGHCDRVVNLSLDTNEPANCPHCKKKTVTYYPPVNLADN
jgi:rubrerythrin